MTFPPQTLLSLTICGLGTPAAAGVSACWVTLHGVSPVATRAPPERAGPAFATPNLPRQTLYQTPADLSVLSLTTSADALFILFYFI